MCCNVWAEIFFVLFHDCLCLHKNFKSLIETWKYFCYSLALLHVFSGERVSLPFFMFYLALRLLVLNILVNCICSSKYIWLCRNKRIGGGLGRGMLAQDFASQRNLSTYHIYGESKRDFSVVAATSGLQTIQWQTVSENMKIKALYAFCPLTYRVNV